MTKLPPVDQNYVGVQSRRRRIQRLCVTEALIHRFLHLLYSKPVPEHDVVPEGSVDIQVYLFDLCGEGMSLLLHFLEDKEKDKVMD